MGGMNESLHAWERGSIGTGLHRAFCFSSLFTWIKGGRGEHSISIITFL